VDGRERDLRSERNPQSEERERNLGGANKKSKRIGGDISRGKREFRPRESRPGLSTRRGTEGKEKGHGATGKRLQRQERVIKEVGYQGHKQLRKRVSAFKSLLQQKSIKGPEKSSWKRQFANGQCREEKAWGTQFPGSTCEDESHPPWSGARLLPEGRQKIASPRGGLKSEGHSRSRSAH